MFTGIIESIGKICKIEEKGTNKTFWIESALSQELKIDQSVAHNGICLTVENIEGNFHQVTAIDETLKKTNLSDWKIGDIVNIERCLKINGRLDGHIVQGHVDTTGTCIEKTDQIGSYLFRFEFPQQFAALIIEKGSICVNGISLTAFDVSTDSFAVAIIPYTFQHTNIKNVEVGTAVNLEFDVVGKYTQRFQELKNGNNN